MADMIITPADLAGHLQQDLDTYTATQAIEVATGWIQVALGNQKILQVNNETVTLDGGETILWLPQRPVVSVGTVTTTDTYGVVDTPVLGTDYRVRGARLKWSWPGRIWPELVTVTYSHGYAPGAIPQEIRGVCLSASARLYHNPEGFRSQTVGATSWTVAGPADEGAGTLTESERRSLPKSVLVA